MDACRDNQRTALAPKGAHARVIAIRREGSALSEGATLMSDEQGIPTGDSPDTPQITPEDYKHLQAAYTRSQQELKELQGVWEDESKAAERAREKFGWELADTDDDPNPDDDYLSDEVEEDPRLREVEELKKWRQEVEQREQEATRTAEWEGWEAYIKSAAEEAGHELRARDVKALKLDCISKDGWPVDKEIADKALSEYLGEYFTEPAPAKKSGPSAPPKGGKAVTGQVDLSDFTESERRAWMVEQMRARTAQ